MCVIENGVESLRIDGHGTWCFSGGDSNAWMHQRRVMGYVKHAGC